jgi:hypothetical protein
MGEWNNNATLIYHKDFTSMVEVNDLEVFEKSQVDYYLNQLGSVLEKSESFELTVEDKEKETLIKSELNSLSVYLVKSDDNTDTLKFVRTKQVDWNKDEEGNLMKGISGTYLNTQLNRELGRVGLDYDNVDAKKF